MPCPFFINTRYNDPVPFRIPRPPSPCRFSAARALTATGRAGTNRPMLYDLLPPASRTVSFVGVARDAGKTTALGAALAEHERRGVRAGVLSVGMDGERRDAVSGRDKPCIMVFQETLVATAARALRATTAAIDVLETTGIHTPLGELIVGRVRRPGEVLLAGVRHREDVRRVAELLRAHGAERVLVDGAFDRFAAADPATSDAVVLSTGMTVGGTVEAVADVTAGWITALAPPLASGEDVPPEAFRDRVAIRRAGEWEGAELRTLLEPPTGPLWESGALEAVYAPGLVSDRVFAWLPRALEVGGVLVVRDPTRVVTADAARARFLRRYRLEALGRAEIAAITVNPWRAGGSPVASDALVNAVRQVAGDIPVLDVRVSG